MVRHLRRHRPHLHDHRHVLLTHDHGHTPQVQHLLFSRLSLLDGLTSLLVWSMAIRKGSYQPEQYSDYYYVLWLTRRQFLPRSLLRQLLDEHLPLLLLGFRPLLVLDFQHPWGQSR